jgi:uncharacterized protein YjbI with pentapeptide repeats
MTQEKLQEILALHLKFLEGYPTGVRANLSGAKLQDANLIGATMSTEDGE